jgi:ferric-dicitrate binding protein FerR (iron transport regulator)
MSQEKYIDLIHKELTASLTIAEQKQLSEWLHADMANQQLAEEIRLVWEHTELPVDSEHLLSDVDVDADFNVLMERIHQDVADTNKKDVKVVPLFRRGWVAAAGLALILGLSATLYFTSDAFEKRNWELAESSSAPQMIQLSDGSTVHLNANSSLHYPASFDGENRTVELKGEAFFDIAKDPQHPFIVQTPFEEVTVLGTSFNVRAFENEPNSEVSVSTGKVSVQSNITNTILEPNDKVIVDHSSGVMELKEIEAHNELAWLTGSLIFDNATVPDVLHDLENQFNISFDYDYQNWENCLFTASFNATDLDTIFTTMSTVLDMEIQAEGDDQYQISGGGCE